MKLSKVSAPPSLALPTLNIKDKLPIVRAYRGLFQKNGSGSKNKSSRNLLNKNSHEFSKDTITKTATEDAEISLFESKDLQPSNNPEAYILYKGTKNFWRTRCNLDITFVDHRNLSCIEIIAYNPQTDNEAARLYLNAEILLSKISLQEIQAKAEDERENRIRCRKSFSWETLLLETKNSFLANYILSRINMAINVEKTTASPSFTIFLIQSYSDIINEETGLLDIIIPNKPLTLIPYRIETNKKVIPIDEMKKMMEDINQEKQNVGRTFSAITTLVKEARSIMGITSNERHDSFAFLNNNQQQNHHQTNANSSSGLVGRKRSSIIGARRTSIDDSHIMENTNNTLVSDALEKARALVFPGLSKQNSKVNKSNSSLPCSSIQEEEHRENTKQQQQEITKIIPSLSVPTVSNSTSNDNTSKPNSADSEITLKLMLPETLTPPLSPSALPYIMDPQDLSPNNSRPREKVDIIKITGPPDISPHKFSKKHKSHNHGLRYVNSWGSMNKISESFYNNSNIVSDDTLIADIAPIIDIPPATMEDARQFLAPAPLKTQISTISKLVTFNEEVEEFSSTRRLLEKEISSNSRSTSKRDLLKKQKSSLRPFIGEEKEKPKKKSKKFKKSTLKRENSSLSIDSNLSASNSIASASSAGGGSQISEFSYPQFPLVEGEEDLPSYARSTISRQVSVEALHHQSSSHTLTHEPSSNRILVHQTSSHPLSPSRSTSIRVN